MEAGPGDEARKRLVAAALEAFSARGFDATTTREIARRAGMSPAGLYVHFPSKVDILLHLCSGAHDEVYDLLKHATSVDADPVNRFAGVISAFVRWHCENHRLARIVQHELRSLDRQLQSEILKGWRAIETLVRDEILTLWAATGAAPQDNLDLMVRGILSMAIDVGRWWSPSQRPKVDVDVLCDSYGEYACRIVGVQPSTGPARNSEHGPQRRAPRAVRS